MLENDDYFHKSQKILNNLRSNYKKHSQLTLLSVGQAHFQQQKFQFIFCWTLMSRHNVLEIQIFGNFLMKDIILLLELLILSMYRQYSYKKKSKGQQF